MCSHWRRPLPGGADGSQARLLELGPRRAHGGLGLGSCAGAHVQRLARSHLQPAGGILNPPSHLGLDVLITQRYIIECVHSTPHLTSPQNISAFSEPR